MTSRTSKMATGGWYFLSFSALTCVQTSPLPQKKKSGEETKRRDSSPDFLFLRDWEGGCLYTGYQCSHSTTDVQQELKQRYWDSLCETEAFHQARHRTAGFYCIPNVRDVSVLVAYYAGYLLSRHCELWPKIKSQILLSDKCTTNLSFQSIVDPTGVWRSTWLFHHICYTSQRLEYLVTFPVNKMYFTWNV